MKKLSNIWKSIVNSYLDHLIDEIDVYAKKCFITPVGVITLATGLYTGDSASIALQLGECLTTTLINTIKTTSTRKILNDAFNVIEIFIATGILASDLQSDGSEFDAITTILDAASAAAMTAAEVSKTSA